MIVKYSYIVVFLIIANFKVFCILQNCIYTIINYQNLFRRIVPYIGILKRHEGVGSTLVCIVHV